MMYEQVSTCVHGLMTHLQFHFIRKKLSFFWNNKASIDYLFLHNHDVHDVQ